MIRKILAWICCFSVFLLLLSFLKGCTLVKKPAIKSTLSVIIGVKGLKIKKAAFAWAGIIIVLFDIVAILVVFGIYAMVSMPAKNARKQEIMQFQNEISNYETYADLMPFD